MTAAKLILLLATLLQAVSNERQHSAPVEAKTPTYLISGNAHQMIDPLDARELADDGPFVKTLRSVLDNQNFSDADKADAFFLMRMKFEWAFIGAVSIPPGLTYDRVFGMYLQTYREYHKAVGAGHDVKGLLELAKARDPDQIVRASSALLLAAVLDPDATRPAVIELCDPKLVEASVAPPIAIHHLALCAALCDVGEDGMTKLATLASTFPFEESQEDVLLMLAYSQNEKANKLIRQFAEEQAPKKFDLAVQFALTVLRSTQKAEEFQAWAQQLAAKGETEDLKKSLLDWVAAEPGPVGPFHPQRGLMKLWDGFNLILYDDGMQLKFGDKFSGFLPRP